MLCPLIVSYFSNCLLRSISLAYLELNLNYLQRLKIVYGRERILKVTVYALLVLIISLRTVPCGGMNRGKEMPLKRVFGKVMGQEWNPSKSLTCFLR